MIFDFPDSYVICDRNRYSMVLENYIQNISIIKSIAYRTGYIHLNSLEIDEKNLGKVLY